MQAAQQKLTIEEEIERHRENGSNILIPTTKLETNDFYAPVIDECRLNISQGDAYSRGNDKFALTFQGLNRLAVCAGVQWHPYETRRIDNGGDRLYIAFQAVGGIRKADGSMVWHKASYDLDLEVVHEEIEETHRNKCKDWKKTQKEKDAYVKSATARDWRQKRRHKHALAESGAKARVLRSILNVKNLYTEAELNKPFIVVRYIFQPPTDDPNVRRQLIDQSIKAMQSVYGSTPGLPYYPREDDYIDIPPPAEAAAEPGGDPEPPGEQPPATNFEVMDADMWTNATRAEKIKEIMRVAEHVNYDLASFEERAGEGVDDMDEAKLDKLYKNLCGMI